jgi:erythromycin esterase-like protein
MKQFLVINALAAILAMGSLADARLVSTRAQCLAACGNATTQTCGWITKRGKFNRCRAKLINQCKRFGTDRMCPPPAAPPVTTATTLRCLSL